MSIISSAGHPVGYGCGSAHMCFIARPVDGAFEFEEEILRQLLEERNYDTHVVLQRVDLSIA